LRARPMSRPVDRGREQDRRGMARRGRVGGASRLAPRSPSRTSKVSSRGSVNVASTMLVLRLLSLRRQLPTPVELRAEYRSWRRGANRVRRELLPPSRFDAQDPSRQPPSARHPGTAASRRRENAGAEEVPERAAAPPSTGPGTAE
jgi:hypothetical protein